MVFSAAVVGCGRIGCEFDDDPLRKIVNTHAGAYVKNLNTRLDALCDIDVNKLQKYGKKYAVKQLFTNVDELLEKARPDLLSVCTTPDLHEEITIKAARANVKGIFCEKPIASSIASAKRMIDVCKENNVILMIDHQRRFDPLISTIKKEIEHGLIGDVYHSTFYYTAGIYNTGTHMLDLMRCLFGDIEWVMSQYSKVSSLVKDDPNIDGVLQFKNGTLAFINAQNVKDYLIFEQDILGSKGRLRIINSSSEVEYYSVDNSKNYAGYKELKRTQLPFEMPKDREIWINAITHLVNCVKENCTPVSSGHDGLSALEAIHALIKSSEEMSKKIYL